MHKTIRKTVSLFLCAAVIAGMLSACGKTAPGGEKKDPEENAVTSEENEPAENGSLQKEVISDELIETAAVYPDPVAKNMDAGEYYESDAHWDWWAGVREKAEASEAYRDDMNRYYQEIMENLLVSEDDGNTVCSPLNTYIAFALLSETTDGNTRQQILDLLRAQDAESLRERISALWETNYADTPALKCLLANSHWLRNITEYNQDTLDRAAKLYHASSFRGDPGSDEMNKALQKWTDENTGGLLGEYTKDMKLDPATVLAIVSTIYYKAAWLDEFYSEGNTRETFHGTKGDSTVEMMHRSDTMAVNRTDRFTSVGLGLQDSGSMYFYLPAEGVDVNDLAKDPDVLREAAYDGDVEWSYPLVNLSLPKFRVSGKTDLLETIKKLGVTDALDPGLSDFTPLTKDPEEAEGLFIGAAEHAALVEVDEKGVTGAAYTELMVTEGAALPDETIDLVFDRPFFFIVTGVDGSVLFSGIVRNID